ncbi:YibE/F family protein [Lactobacillus johnsonii]|uniref:YibE/F family protein n=1 Tax=Lactobacillus johnsonii TaxID=33959 RepID=A0A9X4X9M1_LACJH|nr:YibE/F family protein [Lactobacillus johnsonii]MTE03088.1 YibE/F family protein [Lactobacillus johnsonii]
MKKNAKIWLSLAVLFVGVFFTLITYFSTAFASKPIAVITDRQITDTLVDKTKDNYENKDEVRQQNLHLKILSGKYKGKTFLVTNTYSPSQAVSQKYRPHQRVIVSFIKGKPNIKGKPKLVEPKRDWVVVLSMFLTISVIVLITGKQASLLLISMILNSIIFYFVIKSDVKENGTRIFLIYSIAAILFTFVSLVIVQGLNQKMLVTLTATLLGVFVSFGIFYLIMKLTHERGIDYEAVDYATQDPRALFLSQTILGVLGAVMDEATDIVSSLYALAKHKADLTFKELFISGRTLGQEIMGPLINVLVLIFMAEALPMTILYLRDNNTLVYTFKYTLSLGVIQSLSSAIGIVLTVIFATLCSAVFLRNKKAEVVEK